MTKLDYRKWTIKVVCIVGLFLFFLLVVIAIIDPYMQYHKPLNNSYIWHDERYINPGVIKNYDYECIVTGSSMTQNFKSYDIEDTFHETFIRTSSAGAGLKEINKLVLLAIDNNSNLKTVFRGIDYYSLIADSEYIRKDMPEYLYDDNILNDIYYLLNRNTVERTVIDVVNLLKNGGGTTFDNYCSWEYPTGKEVVFKDLMREKKKIDIVGLTDDEKQLVNKG